MTTAHELGHSMGLVHAKQGIVKGGTFDYGRGYGIENEFVTIMSYESSFNAYNKYKYNYSSPDLDCDGYECGVDSELENGADAVKALKYAIGIVADYN